MAEAAVPDLFTEQELTCSICLDLFSQPVSTPCGHNFCQVSCTVTPAPETGPGLPATSWRPPPVFQVCIGGYWASSTVCSCPLCKRQFDERPQLSVNKVFAVIADKYKHTHYGAAGAVTPVQEQGPAPLDAGAEPAGPAGEDAVWCDICTGVKRPAVRSCLTCTASYCAEHVQPHQASAFYSKHPLMEPREALRGRTCSVHRRLLEVRPPPPPGSVEVVPVKNSTVGLCRPVQVFCKTCQRCICAICVMEEHRIHKTVSVQTERQVKQVDDVTTTQQ